MLILASASNARRQLLEKAGIPHLVIISGLSEENFDNLKPKELVKQLSIAKAKQVSKKVLFEQKKDLSKNIVTVLGCDSIFEFQGEVFGKPKDQ